MVLKVEFKKVKWSKLWMSIGENLINSYLFQTENQTLSHQYNLLKTQVFNQNNNNFSEILILFFILNYWLNLELCFVI